MLYSRILVPNSRVRTLPGTTQQLTPPRQTEAGWKVLPPPMCHTEPIGEMQAGQISIHAQHRGHFSASSFRSVYMGGSGALRHSWAVRQQPLPIRELSLQRARAPHAAAGTNHGSRESCRDVSEDGHAIQLITFLLLDL